MYTCSLYNYILHFCEYRNYYLKLVRKVTIYFFNSCESLRDCDVTDFQHVIFSHEFFFFFYILSCIKKSWTCTFGMRLYLRDRYCINMCAKREDCYGYTAKLIRILKKFANTKNPHYSQIRSLYILVTIYIIEVMINYVISKNVRFDKIRTCMKVHISSGVARQIARKLTLTCIFLFLKKI